MSPLARPMSPTSMYPPMSLNVSQLERTCSPSRGGGRRIRERARSPPEAPPVYSPVSNARIDGAFIVGEVEGGESAANERLVEALRERFEGSKQSKTRRSRVSHRSDHD